MIVRRLPQELKLPRELKSTLEALLSLTKNEKDPDKYFSADRINVYGTVMKFPVWTGKDETRQIRIDSYLQGALISGYVNMVVIMYERKGKEVFERCYRIGKDKISRVEELIRE